MTPEGASERLDEPRKNDVLAVASSYCEEPEDIACLADEIEALVDDRLAALRTENARLAKRCGELVDAIYHAWDSSKHPAVGVSMALNRLTPAEISAARAHAAERKERGA